MDEIIPTIPPVPPVPPTLPPVGKSQNWLKILLAGIGVLIVLGLFGNLYLLARSQKPAAEVTPTTTPIAATPTQNPTANWKTYTSSLNKYQFKYPGEDSGLTFFECKDEGLAALNKIGVAVPCSPRGSYYSIEIRVENGGTITNNDLKAISGVESKREDFTLAGTKGLKVTFIRTEPAPLPDKWVEILVFNNSQRYHFVLSDMAYENYFDQILSTFQFLN